MSLPVFFPVPEIALVLPEGVTTSLRKLCKEAGLECKVTGLATRRPLKIAVRSRMRIIRLPGTLSAVWLGVPNRSQKRRALLALGMLAYAIFHAYPVHTPHKFDR